MDNNFNNDVQPNQVPHPDQVPQNNDYSAQYAQYNQKNDANPYQPQQPAQPDYAPYQPQQPVQPDYNQYQPQQPVQPDYNQYQPHSSLFSPITISTSRSSLFSPITTSIRTTRFSLTTTIRQAISSPSISREAFIIPSLLTLPQARLRHSESYLLSAVLFQWLPAATVYLRVFPA